MIQYLFYEQARRSGVRLWRVCFFVPLTCESRERNPLRDQFRVQVFADIATL